MSARRSRAAVVGDAVLWVASIGGVICILGVITAVVFHVTLIMFKTGSMAPTIPAGSLAVVHEIPASEIRVGDIVTVDREGQLPVTHRVTSVQGSGDTRTITLRGDANPTDDIAPYVVSQVRIVWLAIPGWASVVVWFSNPVVLGALTLGATALVTWAFWPRDEHRGRRRAGRRGQAVAASGTSLLLAVALVAGQAPDAARAAEVETVIQGTYLTLTSVRDPVLMSTMTTGMPVGWQVGVEAAPPDPGTVHLGVQAVAPLPDPGDFTIDVQACPVRWVAGACAGTSAVWLPATDLAGAMTPTTTFGAREVGSMASTDEIWLMVTVTRTTITQPQPAQLRLWAWGAGTLSVGGGPLASTGPAGSWFPPMLLGGVAIGLGLLLAGIAARRRERADG
jgi:signal peptidase I